MAIRQTTEISVNKHSNMLIIGKADTLYKYNEIVYADDVDDVMKNYGDSPLANAFKAANEAGVESVFLLNIEDARDLFTVMEEIAQHDFAYIIPLDIMLSDFFYDTYNDNRKTFYIEYMLRQMGHWAESVILATDKHASLFEDQDDFVSYMNITSRRFEYYCTSDLRMDDVVFVANNLEDWDYANLALGIALCTTDASVYPTADFGNAMFFIDRWDNPYNWGYFMNHADGTTTAENLLNFTAGGPDKIVTIERIVKLIKRELDLSEFEGRLYTEYQRVRMLTKLTAYLDSLVGTVLNKYEIESIEPLKNANQTITVLTRFSVWPVNSTESCTVTRSINV